MEVSKLQQAKSLKTAALWSIFGTFLFILPGLIFWIITLIKIISYPQDVNSPNSKTAPVVVFVLFNIFFIGAFLIIGYANREIVSETVKISSNKEFSGEKEAEEQENWD